jgi:hypothetical protein
MVMSDREISDLMLGVRDRKHSDAAAPESSAAAEPEAVLSVPPHAHTGLVLTLCPRPRAHIVLVLTLCARPRARK